MASATDQTPLDDEEEAPRRRFYPHWVSSARSALRQYAEWVEALHPRQPAGTPQGGEFAPKGSSSSDGGKAQQRGSVTVHDRLRALREEYKRLRVKRPLTAQDRAELKRLRTLLLSREAWPAEDSLSAFER